MSWSQIKYFDVPFFTPLSYQNRTHKLCKLPNGILTLLISDPTEKTSGCSLTVATGSHNDPDEIPGLAHLCEHMVLAAGSKRYADPGLYHEVIAKNNGSQNAFTTGEQTTFYFELPNIHHSSELSFDQAVDIFASFFTEPLFNPTLMNKEIYAVQSEHDGNTSVLTKILYHATRLLADKSHPFSRFSTGNISTLKGLPHIKGFNLRNILLDYFRENYVASRMTLCIRGSQSLNALTKLALAKFGDIKSNNVNKKNILGSIKSSKLPSLVQEKVNISNSNIPYDAWSSKYEDSLCFAPNPEHNVLLINSIKQPIVRFVFPVTRKNTRLTSKDILMYGDFWYELFGDESPGSFGHYLMEKSWITCCYAFTSKFALDNTGLILELTLTRTGWEKIDCIIETLLFQIVPIFTKEYTVEMARFLSEQYNIDLVRFLCQTVENSPMEECSALSGLLQEDLEALNPACIFKGSTMLVDDNLNMLDFFNENKNGKKWWIGQAIKFQGLLKEFMTGMNLRMVLLGELKECPLFHTASSESNLLLTDSFYEFDYLKSKYDFTDIKNDTLSNYKFHLPPKNTFKPTWASEYCHVKGLLSDSLRRSQVVSFSFPKGGVNNAPPHLVSKNAYHEMWAISDESSECLRSIVSFEISSLDLKPSPENTINLEILGQVLFLSLSSELYPSLKLGFSYEIASSSKGDVRIGFTISGFSEGLIYLVKAIITAFKLISVDAYYPSREMLRKARILVRSNYDSAVNDNSVKVASMGLLIVLEKNIWTLEDRIRALEDIDMDCFKDFCGAFLKSSKYLTLLIQGNMLCADEINEYLSQNFTQHLRGGIQEEPNQQLLQSTKVLDPGTNVCFQHSGQKEDPNNGIVYFIQTGDRRDNEALTLTAFTVYLISHTLISELRNKRQIGYLVIGGLRFLCNTMGLHVTVMSSGSPLSLEARVNEYFSYLEMVILRSLTEREFQEKYVNGYVRLLNGKNFAKLQKSSGPANLLDEIVADVQNGDSSILNSARMRRHRKVRNQILDGRYEFHEEDEPINVSLIKDMTLKQYLQFFKQKISIYSESRSKISIMITSQMTQEEVVNRKIFLQLEAFLKMKGFTIQNTELHRIVEHSNGKATILVKDLYTYFNNRNEAWNLCSVVLRELFKIIMMNVKGHGYISQDGASKAKTQDWIAEVKPALELEHIRDLNIYKKK